jgi:hypothetical protein
MLRMHSSVSLADLTSAGIRLRPSQAVTLVREIVLLVARGGAVGVPSPHVVRLFPSGAIGIEGPVAADGPDVARAAQLLESLLPGFDAAPDFRVPGALRLILARAAGTLDLPPYQSLDELATALTRFAHSDAAGVVRDLVASMTPPQAYSSSDQPRPSDEMTLSMRQAERRAAVRPVTPATRLEEGTELTVSDIRRARRATGLTLAQVSERSRIPVSLLRQLEWGYLEQWPTGHYGRTQLVRYARGAGLDDQVVVRTLWPMLEEVAQQPVRVVEGTVEPEPAVPPQVAIAETALVIAPVAPLQAVDPLDSVELERVAIPPEEERRLRPLGKVAAALAAAALVVIATAPGLWDRTAGVLAPPVTDPPARSGLASPQRETPTRTEARTDPGVPPSAAPEARASEPEAPAAAPRVSQRAPGELVPTSGRVDPSADAQPAPGLTEEAYSYSPSFASVGSAFFYHTRADGPSALVRADTDTSGAVLKITRIVNDSARNFHARPSPDGTRIAFDSDREGVRAVFIADADGKRVRRISADGFAAIPSWSPDGEALAYIRAEENRPRVWNIWITDLANGATRRVTNYRVGQPWGASWFPDGRRIAYSHEDRLIVRDLETGMERVYPSPRKGRLVRTPAVSPDGRRVIFQVHRDGAWLLDVEDGGMRKVLADPSAEEYAWSPDGRRIAYHSRESGEWGVWVMAPHQ